MTQDGDVEHILASETYRYGTFSRFLDFSELTRQQLALAGFICQENECICPQCGIRILINSLDKNKIYSNDFFRKLHRERISRLGKRCTFLLCETGTNMDDLRSIVFSRELETDRWIDAELPEYSEYSARLGTFQSWPYANTQNSHVTPAIMAKHGFYFSGQHDEVTCFYCGNSLTAWSDLIDSRDENIVQLEHAKFFPCRFINYTAGSKYVGEAGSLHVVRDEDRRLRNPIPLKSSTSATTPQSIDECLLTYADWPEDAPISPKDLSRTGFYYLGEGLKVKCYMCQLEVDDWNYGMTALGTHSRRQNNCELIRAIRSTKSEIESVNEKWRLQTLQGLSFGSPSDEKLARELAACGFYRFKNTNNIRCAYCGVLIKPKFDCSIMSQHRSLAKQARKTGQVDCLIVRAQCAVNVVIPDRERFAEYAEYQSVFARQNTFESYKERHGVSDEFIRERADAGFFLETTKRMRCFQCGNSLSIHDKKLQEKYPQYDIAKLHAHFYPTCEWIREILGAKYIAQVLHDHNKSDEIEHQSYQPQISSISHRTTLNSCSSTSSMNGSLEFGSLSAAAFSDCSDESDDDGYETVATSFEAHTGEQISPMQSPPIDPSRSAQHFAATPISPTLESMQTDTQSIDPMIFFVYESNRLKSFQQQKRSTFAERTAEELAYAGFYLSDDGKMVRCPWCKIELKESKFNKILTLRPSGPDSPLNDEPWTAMCVHRHENGQVIDKDHPPCPWVRRQSHARFLNVILNESKMKYPEYSSYSAFEKRVKSFEIGWDYPSGSLLSNFMMAQAGFIYLGDGKVCCYYCGNKLQKFEPLDCPFAEHAAYHPLCDYIIAFRGSAYVNRIYKESHHTSTARQKYEMNGTQKFKCIYYGKATRTIDKTKRHPVPRLRSRLSSSKSIGSRSESSTTDPEHMENACHLCCENLPQYEYAPCHHYPMCGECSVKLTGEQHQQCIICRRPAKLAEINSRF